MKRYLRWPLVFVLVMLQSMMPLVHAHAGMAGFGHGGLHMPEIAQDAPSSSDQAVQSGTLAKTIVIADFLNTPQGDYAVLPARLLLTALVAELRSGPTWVTTPSPRPVLLQSDCLIPFSCAPPRT